MKKLFGLFLSFLKVGLFTFGGGYAMISLVENELSRKAMMGKVSRSKTENTAERYLEAGAPVIDGYEDYVKCLAEVPGIRSAEKQQLQLF